jgi:hypothetical protein
MLLRLLSYLKLKLLNLPKAFQNGKSNPLFLLRDTFSGYFRIPFGKWQTITRHISKEFHENLGYVQPIGRRG